MYLPNVWSDHNQHLWGKWLLAKPVISKIPWVKIKSLYFLSRPEWPHKILLVVFHCSVTYLAGQLIFILSVVTFFCLYWLEPWKIARKMMHFWMMLQMHNNLSFLAARYQNHPWMTNKEWQICFEWVISSLCGKVNYCLWGLRKLIRITELRTYLKLKVIIISSQQTNNKSLSYITIMN